MDKTNIEKITEIVNKYFGDRGDIVNIDIVQLESLVEAEFKVKIITPLTAKDFKNKEEIITYFIKKVEA